MHIFWLIAKLKMAVKSILNTQKLSHEIGKITVAFVHWY